MVTKLASDGTEGVTTIPRLPPLRFGEAFEEVYDVILILDDREQFATKGFVEQYSLFSSILSVLNTYTYLLIHRSRSIVDNISSVF